MRLILASNSPRRKEFLTQGGYEFTITCSDFDEKSNENDPKKLSVELALGKAKSVFDSLKHKEDKIVLGADTIVFFDGEILGKPKDDEHAKQMLKALSSKKHSVITGYAIITNDNIISGHVQTFVTFNDLTNELIEEYVKKGLSKGKAGAYGIQDGYPFVAKYEGSYSNVVGLPTEEVFPILDKLL